MARNLNGRTFGFFEDLICELGPDEGVGSDFPATDAQLVTRHVTQGA